MEGYKTTRSNNLSTNMERVVGFLKVTRKMNKYESMTYFLSTYCHATLPSYNSYHLIVVVVTTILRISSFANFKKNPLITYRTSITIAYHL